MRLAFCVLLVGTGLSVRQLGDSPEVLVDNFLRKGMDRFDEDTRSRLASAVAKAPKTMAILTAQSLAKKDIAKAGEYDQVQRGIRLLSSTLDESAVKELGVLYERFRGQENNLQQLRHNIMLALTSNSFGRLSLVESKTDDVVAMLNKQLVQDESPYVLRVGLRVHSSWAKDLPEPLLKHVKKHLSSGDLASAERRVKINQGKDYDSLFDLAMAWIDELIKAGESRTVEDWQGQQDTETFHFLARKIKGDKSGVRKKEESLRKRLDDIDKKLSELDKQIEKEKDPEKKKRLFLSQSQMQELKTSLGWVLVP